MGEGRGRGQLATRHKKLTNCAYAAEGLQGMLIGDFIGLLLRLIRPGLRHALAAEEPQLPRLRIVAAVNPHQRHPFREERDWGELQPDRGAGASNRGQ